MLKGSRTKKFLAFLSAMAMTASICVAAPAISVSAEEAFMTDSYEKLNPGDSVKTQAAIANADKGNTYTVVEENGKKVGKFTVSQEGTAAAAAEAKVPSYNTVVTGNVILEQRLKFEFDESNPCAMNTLRYRLKIGGQREVNGAKAWWGDIELADIYPSKICSYSSPNGTYLSLLPGSNVFTPGKWYTVKVGIDTANEVYHLYYKQDGCDWKTATPPDGMSLRQKKAAGGTSYDIDYTEGIKFISYGFFANKGAVGSVYHSDFKAYTAPFIAASVTETSTAADAPAAAAAGFSENFESYAVGDAYTMADTTVWSQRNDTKLIHSEIIADPEDASNKVEKIIYPASAQKSEIGYYFAPIRGKMVYRNKFRFSPDMNAQSGSLQFHIGYPVADNANGAMTDTRLMFITRDALILKAATTAEEHTQTVKFAADTWYEVALVINTDTSTYECYLKKPNEGFKQIAANKTLTLPTASAGNNASTLYPVVKDNLSYAENGIGYVGITHMNNSAATSEADRYICLDDISLSQLSDGDMTVVRTDSGATVSYQILNAADSRDCTMYLIAYTTENGVEKVENIAAKPVHLNAFSTGAADSLSVTCSANAKVRALLLENSTLRPIQAAQPNE